MGGDLPPAEGLVPAFVVWATADPNGTALFNLKTAVGREKDVQDIDVHGKFEKRVVTLLVMSAFSNFPGASRACADFRDPTAVFRFKGRLHRACP
jgi:hypothetical protein